MVNLTITFGIIFILLGMVAYLGTGRESFTALIPTFFGIPFLILGIFGRKEALRKHTMHAASILALIGFFGTMGGLGQLASYAGGETLERPAAAIVQSVMAIMCAIFLFLSIKSFISARKQAKPSP